MTSSFSTSCSAQYKPVHSLENVAHQGEPFSLGTRHEGEIGSRWNRKSREETKKRLFQTGERKDGPQVITTHTPKVLVYFSCLEEKSFSWFFFTFGSFAYFHLSLFYHTLWPHLFLVSACLSLTDSCAAWASSSELIVISLCLYKLWVTVALRLTHLSLIGWKNVIRMIPAAGSLRSGLWG